MQQYKIKGSRPQPKPAITEDRQARSNVEQLAERLRWTESLVEEQRRELRRLSAEISSLQEFVANKLRR